MFLTLAELFRRAVPDQPTAEENVFLVHPIQLSRWLDEAWAAARRAPLLGTEVRSPFLGDDGIITTLQLPTPQDSARLLLPSGIDLTETEEFSGLEGPTNVNGTSGEDTDDFGLLWHHLVYAYLIECTGVVEVFAEVLRRLVVGETLDALSLPAAEWARATEELFFREPPLFSIGGTESELRPHRRVNRRNVYWRMFGLDLPHGLPSRWPPGPSSDQSWKQDTGTVNSGFREKWTELLRQVWLGLENRRNETGPNPADAEHRVLLQADHGIAHVQPGGDPALRGSVVLAVRVEKEQWNTADLHAPYLHANGSSTDGDVDDERCSVVVRDERGRQAERSHDRRGLFGGGWIPRPGPYHS